MNILVPISWLKDFLKTEASAEKIAETLSLCSQSVERIHKVGKEEVLDIEITVNRYDCLSVIGLAREAAAILPQFGIKASFLPPKIPLFPESSGAKNFLDVKITDPSICPRFTAVLLDEVKVGPSPKWLRERLNLVNIRSLNNVVDISNYLMMETGQPIHTFDFDKIKKQKMVMRLSKKGEKVVTLDTAERIFSGGDIVIEDGEGRLIDLCGIMGGKNSEIDEGTKRVLFFVQAYDPVRIRKTSMSLGLRTEAAMRFERGIDLEGIIPVINRGVSLMSQLAGGKVAGKMIDIYPQKQVTEKISLDFDFVGERLGVNLPAKEILKILKDLGFSVIKENAKGAILNVPSWRAKDIKIKEDVLEEVARIYGYFRLPSRLPPLTTEFILSPQPAPKKGTINPSFKWEEKIKDLLKAFGFSETYNFSFVSEKDLERCLLNKEDHLKLANPLTSDLEYLRLSLFPSLLQAWSKNQANFSQIKIFEMANCYWPKKNDLPEEKMKTALLTNEENFRQLKGLLEEIFIELGISGMTFSLLDESQNNETNNLWQKNKTAIVKKGGLVLATMGEINKKILSNYQIKTPVFGLELEMAAISSLANNDKTFNPIPEFPPIIEDLSFVFPEKTAIGEVIFLIKNINPLVGKIELIDSFKETKTFRLIYQDLKGNLTDKEIKPVREKIIESLEKKGIKLKNK